MGTVLFILFFILVLGFYDYTSLVIKLKPKARRILSQAIGKSEEEIDSLI